MRRSALLFIALIVLPSLALACLAIYSARDQQVVLEHQQVIISQNIADALARSVQDRMDQQRADFVAATQQLLTSGPSPQAVADDFNRRIRAAWSMADIGFAVDLGGRIYSPQPYEGSGAKKFRTENDRFLGNLENVAVYSFASKTGSNLAQTEPANAPQAPKPGSMEELFSKKATEPQKVAQEEGKAASDQLAKGSLATAAPASPELTGTASPVESRAKDESETSTDSSADISSAARAPQHAQRTPEAKTLSKQAPATALDSAKSVLRGEQSGAATIPPESPIVPPASPSTSVSTAPFSPATAALPSNNLQPSPTVTGMGRTNLNADTQASNVSARNVVPQQQVFSGNQSMLSNAVAEQSDFRRVIGSDTSGVLARFLDDKLRLLVWTHPDGSLVYGAQINSPKLVEVLKSCLGIPELAAASSYGQTKYCAAILDDNGHPVAQSLPGFSTDWKHPFVSTEIGQGLPHWEAALYLADPAQIGRTAQTLQATIAFTVILLTTAIALGSWHISLDVRRQMLLAQQKTDFVSNVSHELKTPLTSIRMFADLLAEKRVPDEEKQATYLRIIAAEASRLTRLINNVLDFARLEKNKPPGEQHDCDLADVARDIAGTCAPHLDSGQISFQLEVESEPLPIRGDRDALAQIILNLISNAEKYGGGNILVRVRRQEMPGGALGCIDVLDRGTGIPPREAKAIFQPFHRLEESLSSGIPGTGLGLTLARRMARTHDGDVTYSARAGGGSCFTLSVPLASTQAP